CTETPRGTRGLCASCVSDSECGETASGKLRCLPVSYQGAERGSYCMYDKATLTLEACPLPYYGTVAALSLGGVASEYCIHEYNRTTCEAILGFLSSCESADECGAEGVDDAVCADDGGGLSCSYECAADKDCRSAAKCNLSDSVGYCCTASSGDPTNPCYRG